MQLKNKGLTRRCHTQIWGITINTKAWQGQKKMDRRISFADFMCARVESLSTVDVMSSRSVSQSLELDRLQGFGLRMLSTRKGVGCGIGGRVGVS